MQAQSIHMSDIGYSVSRPFRGNTDTVWLRIPGEQKQRFTINHIVSINYLTWSKAHSIQICPYQAGYSRG